MPVIFLECHALTLPILDRARQHWSGFGWAVRVYTRDATVKAKEVEYIPADVAVVNYWSELLADGLYLLVGVQEQLTGLEKLPNYACDIRYVRRIEYHRRDASYVRKPFVRTLESNSASRPLVEGKLYCTVGRYLQSQLVKAETGPYWHFLTELEAGDYGNIGRWRELEATQIMTLWEWLLIYRWEEYACRTELFAGLFESVEHLPHVALLEGVLAFQNRQMTAARECFETYRRLPALEYGFEYEYEVYVREWAGESFLLRLALLAGDESGIERYGRDLFAAVPRKIGYEANRFLLRHYLELSGFGYGDIDPATTPTDEPFESFLIYTQPRSGSTLLAQELNAHPEIDCLGELLSGEEPLEFLGQTTRQLEYIARRELDAARLGQDTLAAGTKPVRGLKIHGAQMTAYANQPNLWRDLLKGQPKIIYLHRRADVSRALSLGLAFENESFRAHPDFVLYDRLAKLDEYEAAVRQQEAQDTRHLLEAEALGCPVLKVDMREYLSRRAFTQRRICEFLGVGYVPLRASLQKQNSWSVEELLVPAKPDLTQAN